MTLFLKAQCGSFQMLIDVARVLEVFDLPSGSAAASALSITGHITWRDQMLCTVNMPRYLGVPDVQARRLVVVETGIDDPALRLLVLEMESSDSLLSIDSESIVDMEDHHDRLAPVFAGIYSPVDSPACFLVLRFPAVWVLPMFTEVEVA